MHRSCRRKAPRGEETEEEKSNAGRMASGPAATMWQWLEDAVRLLRKTVGYGDREPTYTELLLEQLNNWSSELGLVTVAIIGATWLLLKLGSSGSDGNPSEEEVTPSSSSEDSKVCMLEAGAPLTTTHTSIQQCTELSEPPFSADLLHLCGQKEALRFSDVMNLRAKCVRDVYPSVLLETQRMVCGGTAPLGFVMCDTETFLVIEYAVGGVRLSEIMIGSGRAEHSRAGLTFVSIEPAPVRAAEVIPMDI
ncbi:hypothetical protein HPB50_020192 [Hyalomma asiaticum]|uniref:Uncharacterized protein n=1 Tax=Hyalomma asiaticum TaxID=266040 RepID=A0ACB7TKN5_HYAAI|nr:hypothetical protein HPB50_020192 [Hyalomma asiaticum]